MSRNKKLIENVFAHCDKNTFDKLVKPPSQDIEFEKIQARELYKKIEKWDELLLECPFCGRHAEMWEYEPTPGVFQKAAMCSNDGDEDNNIDPCPMFMPPDGFYKASKIEAAEEWNKRFGRVVIKTKSK